MKKVNTDSTANVSRFARDKRQRVSSAERVERSPRPRRDGDNEGRREFQSTSGERRPRVANGERRDSRPTGPRDS